MGTKAHYGLRVAMISAVMVGAPASVVNAATYRLSDHPDSLAAPPPYGLRLDRLFAGQSGAAGGITTFSFVDVLLRVTTTGSGYTLRIFGDVYGGEDAGASYGFGEGWYSLDYSYTMNVAASGTGYLVNPDPTNNVGTLTALTGDVAGQTFSLFDMADGSGRSFLFLQDDFRLAGTGFEGLNYWVGRGWLGVDGQSTSATRDFLFIGQLIPTPLGASMSGAGLLLLGARRRR